MARQVVPLILRLKRRMLATMLTPAFLVGVAPIIAARWMLTTKLQIPLLSV